MPDESSPEKKIGVVEIPPLKVEFGPDNAQVMKEMIADKYGENEKDLIINALTLLYTISKKAPKATEVSVQGTEGTVFVPIIRSH